MNAVEQEFILQKIWVLTYIQIGEFYEIEKFCELLQLKVEPYDPYETEEDDEQFNYWGSLGKIGPVKELDNETK